MSKTISDFAFSPFIRLGKLGGSSFLLIVLFSVLSMGEVGGGEERKERRREGEGRKVFFLFFKREKEMGEKERKGGDRKKERGGREIHSQSFPFFLSL